MCDTDEDSSAATFASHDNSVITNIGVLTDTGSSMNITCLNVLIKMKQSVRQYLTYTAVDTPKVTMINGKKSTNIVNLNIVNLVDVRQRFGEILGGI